jgi:hypothetical protein
MSCPRNESMNCPNDETLSSLESESLNCPESKNFIEYVIKVKDESSSVSEKHITYEPLLLSLDNTELENKVQEAYLKFYHKGAEGKESPEITIRAKMVWQS